MPYSSVADLPANVKKLAPKAQRQWMHVWNSTYKSCMAKDEGGAAACETEAFQKANGVAKGAKMSDPASETFGWDDPIKLEKTDKKVDYRAKDDKGWQCLDCRFYTAAFRECSLVEGTIEPSYTCDLWTEKLPSQSSSFLYQEQSDRIFIEAPEAFADLSKPTWIPFLPSPGMFHHPLYGDIEITQARNEEFVQSVKDKVYQEHIPLDAEHETKLSGAVAWIKDMRINDNGSADAYVEWTDRGRSLAGGDNPQFKYISPEWFDKWTDPATSIVHNNVIAGGAITTRPFFKDKVLRALVASERGAEIIAAEASMKKCAACGKMYPTSMSACPTCGSTKVASEGDKVPDPKTYAEGSPELQAIIDAAKAEATKGLLAPDSPEFKAQVAKEVAAEVEKAKKAGEPEPSKEFTELQAQLTTQAAELAASRTANESLAASLKTIQNAERVRRFADLVAGKGGENDGGAWVGDPNKHVAFLEQLADKVGESDPMFTAHVEQMNAVAAQAREATVFQQIGSGAPSGGSDAYAKIETKARALMATDPKMSFSDAEAQILSTPEGAQLYKEYNARHAATTRPTS